ncbi:hypothetical protein ES705_31121 [subsurface metagenome]
MLIHPPRMDGPWPPAHVPIEGRWRSSEKFLYSPRRHRTALLQAALVRSDGHEAHLTRYWALGGLSAIALCAIVKVGQAAR